ncbi:MAG: prolipoprotein diacylglyceryl transferase, partial [Saprospiraceae bacterium]|nr:prolipoprotein diacylglyceryl transferase [Saprospiraceae bacterium]
LLGVEIAKKLIGVKQSTGDLFTLPIILGMIIGRIGCFLSGVSEPTFGIETTLPWGMDLGDGLLRHPTSLYEIFFLATLGLLIHRSSQIFPRAGDAFKTFLIAYLIFRFFIDFIKPTEALALGLTSIQLTCLAGIIYYSKSIFRMSRELFQKKDIS